MSISSQKERKSCENSFGRRTRRQTRNLIKFPLWKLLKKPRLSERRKKMFVTTVHSLNNLPERIEPSIFNEEANERNHYELCIHLRNFIFTTTTLISSSWTLEDDRGDWRVICGVRWKRIFKAKFKSLKCECDLKGNLNLLRQFVTYLIFLKNILFKN